MGRRLADEFRQRTTPIDNPEVQQHLDGIGRRLAAQMPETRLPFTFEVVAETPCNAEPYALPGGYLFVSSSLFLAAAVEYEFPSMHTTPPAKAMASIPLVLSFGCPEALPIALRSTRERAEREANTLAIETLQRASLRPGEPAPSAAAQ